MGGWYWASGGAEAGFVEEKAKVAMMVRVKVRVMMVMSMVKTTFLEFQTEELTDSGQVQPRVSPTVAGSVWAWLGDT